MNNYYYNNHIITYVYNLSHVSLMMTPTTTSCRTILNVQFIERLPRIYSIQMFKIIRLHTLKFLNNIIIETIYYYYNKTLLSKPESRLMQLLVIYYFVPAGLV